MATPVTVLKIKLAFTFAHVNSVNGMHVYVQLVLLTFSLHKLLQVHLQVQLLHFEYRVYLVQATCCEVFEMPH